MKKLPNMSKPCKDCPFRKDSKEGWLGKERITEILDAESFTCHKTDRSKQCAGHMHIKGDHNAFVRLANNIGAKLTLEGKELIFNSEEECINHHSYED